MKRMIIILSVLLVASVASAIDKLPAQYYCQYDEDVPEEAKVCADLKAAFEETEFIRFDATDESAHFRILVLPTVRDNHASITVASSFMYPPLYGLALSAATSGYLILPGGLNKENMDLIANRTLGAIVKWMTASEGFFFRDETKPTLETSK